MTHKSYRDSESRTGDRSPLPPSTPEPGHSSSSPFTSPPSSEPLSQTFSSSFKDSDERDSIQKLQIHPANQGHEISAAKLDYLRREEKKFKSSENPSYNRNSGRHIDQAQKSPQTAAQDVTLPGLRDLKQNINIQYQ